MATLEKPEGYRLHKSETENLTTHLSFATALVQDLKVFQCEAPKQGVPVGQLHVLLSAKSLSAEKIIADQNRAVIQKIIAELNKIGWTYLSGHGALLFFTPTDAVLL